VEFEDDAFVLTARAHGENGAIAELLTRGHGRYPAFVAGGGSRRIRPLLQPGSRVTARDVAFSMNLLKSKRRDNS
jgi:DNA repair protein RecO (recombination protein O)